MKKILLFMVAALLVFGLVSCDQEVNTKTYKVAYNANGAVGNVPAPIEVEEGGTTIVPSQGSLSMKGYDFVGWNTKKDGDGRAYKESQSVNVDSDIVLYAQWSIHEYSISYELNGGSYPEGRSNPSTYTIESETFVLYNLVKEGYEFIGWRFKDDSDVLASTNFAIRKGAIGDMSIVAVWKALDTYTVSYDVNGGTGTIKTQSKYKGESLTISSGEDLERAGYTFSCWNTKADGTGSNYNPNDAYGVDADLRLYAKWSPVKYSIKYGLDGGSFPEGSGITEYTIESDTFTLPVPTKAGYVFQGWKAEGSNEVQKTVSIEKGSIGDISFTAVWRELKKYTVSYNANGGSGSVESQSKLEGSSIAIAEQTGIKRNGYTFACWNTKSDGTGTDYKPNAGYSNDADLVLYAKWSPVKYSITYDFVGGALSAGKSNPSDYTIETKTFTLVNPEKDGYRFLGWKESGSTDATAEKNLSIQKGSMGNRSLVAVWKQAKKCTVTFDSNGADGGSVPAQLMIYEGDSFTAPSSDSFYRDGYVFEEWNTKADGSGDRYLISETVEVLGDVTLYAIWNESPLEYTYLSKTDSYSVKCRDKNASSIVIPSMYEGKPVTEIGYEAFKDCLELRDVNIPSSVTKIQERAFFDCKDLSIVFAEGITKIPGCVSGYGAWGGSGIVSITIPSSVTFIGSYAFAYCSGLTEMTIPEGVTTIGSSAFIDCSGLASITILEGVTRIGDSAFLGCSGLSELTIPSSVTSIGEKAFGSSKGRLSIVFADGTTKIPDKALYSVSGVVSVTIPSSVATIGNQAFCWCIGLESINVVGENSKYYVEENCLIERDTMKLVRGCKTSVIPEGVKSIGEYAFGGYKELVDITIPEGVTRIGVSAFDGCSGLVSITIPDGVTSIGYRAFAGCSGLTSITIPSSVTRIGYEAFIGSKALSIVFAEGTKKIPSEALVNSEGASVTIPSSVMTIGDNAFYGCRWLKNITIPEGVTSIEAEAFSGCTGLKEITIPKSVTNMGDRVFEYCDDLSVVFAEGMTEIPSYALYNASGVTSVTIPHTVTSIGERAFCGCSGLSEITIPEGVTSIGAGAFSGCSGLTSITIPEGVTSIGAGAFSRCSGLTSITIPKGITSIEEESFSGCSGLTSITIPEGVTSIGNYAFNGCSGLAGITIPDGVTSIEYFTFSGCSGLTSITIPEGVTSIGRQAFYGCSGLREITIPKSVATMEYDVFNGCKGLSVVFAEGMTEIPSKALCNASGVTSVTIPHTVTSMGDSAFSGCSGLTSITIPENVTRIGDSAFFGCSGLASITIPENVTSIGDYAFSGCNGLKSIAIPENVTRIGRYAFSGCSGLASIMIPENVTSIGDGAFYDCSGLADIKISEGVTGIGDYAFSSCSGLMSITMSESVTSIGNSAFKDCRGLTEIIYLGACSQWNSIRKGSNWNSNTGKYTIHCTDGDIAKK